MPKLEASVSIANCLEKSGRAKTGAETRECLRVEKGFIIHTSPHKQHSFLQQLRKWLCNNPKIFDKLSIIACKSKKSPEIFDIRTNRPRCHCLNLGRLCSNSLLADDMSQV
jgi:hypothetical protein